MTTHLVAAYQKASYEYLSYTHKRFHLAVLVKAAKTPAD
jgi:hypothetical protein